MSRHTSKEEKLRARTNTYKRFIEMLLARKINLNQLKNAVISQQLKIISASQSSRTLCTTSFLTKQAENQAGSSATTTTRVYYGMKCE